MLPDSLTAPAAEIAGALIARRQTVSVAESSAGGLVAAALLSVPGASAYFIGGVVFYSRPGLRAAFGEVDTGLDHGRRSACEQFARYLAAAAAIKHGTDWSVSETGAAGPDGNPYGDPAGHTWVAVRDPAGAIVAEHLLTGQSDRLGNMERFAAHALGALAAAIRAA